MKFLTLFLGLSSLFAVEDTFSEGWRDVIQEETEQDANEEAKQEAQQEEVVEDIQEEAVKDIQEEVVEDIQEEAKQEAPEEEVKEEDSSQDALQEEFQDNMPYGINEELPDALLEIMDQEKYDHSIWGLYVKDLETGKVFFDLNSNELFLPASTSKIASTAALLHALGPDYRFHTPVYASGKIERGELRGNLILVAQGDLTLGGRQSDPDKISFTKMDHITANEIPGAILTRENPLNGIDSLAKQVYDSGIRKIVGEVQIDDSLFETIQKREMVLSPIMINENLIDIVINPTTLDKNAQVDFRPNVPGFVVENQVKTVEKEVELNLSVEQEGKKIIVKGNIPLEEKDVIRTFVVQDPKAFAKAAFINALENQGIKIINRTTRKANSLQNLSQVAVWTSPPLTEYVNLILKVSHNLGADLVPLLLAAHQGKKTFDEGMKMIGDFLIQEVKLSPDTFVMIDAAGGNENRFTPQAEVQLLEYMKNQNFVDFKKYFEAFPILGKDGSMEDFARKTEAAGKVRTKPGTGVSFNLATDKLFLITQALAGYIEGKNGHLFAYMLVVNNAKMPEVKDVFAIFEDEAQITNILYTYTGKKMID